MTVYSLRSVLLLSVSALGMLTGPARADEQEAGQPQAGAIELAPVVVDARQWQEDVQRVPGAVDVLATDSLGNPLSDSLGAIPKVSPNVQIEQSSVQTRVVIRGMTSANTALQDPVGYFVNDVALPHGASQAPQLFDSAQMMILKGPQGALYGRNTEAGAIKVATQDPDWTPTASASLATSVRDGVDDWEPAVVAAGRLSGAVVEDRLAASLAFRTEQSDGVHHNLFDGASDGGKTDRWTLSTGLALQAGPETDVTLKSVVEQNNNGKQRMRYLTGPYATGRNTTNYNTVSWDDSTSAIQSLKVEHHLDDLTLTSITGWTHYERDFQMDLDGGPLKTLPNLLSHQDDALSQEIRLASPDQDSGLRWLAGLYAYQEWTDLDYQSGTPRVGRTTEIDQSGLAAFGQVEVALTDRWRAGVGSRVEWIRQNGAQTLVSSTGQTAYEQTLEQVTLLPRFTLSYDLQPGTMLYGSYARGYLPGGYNYGMATSASTLSYDPEYSWTAEIGAKGRFVQDRLGASLALFRTVTTDKQILDLVPGGTQTISNAARAEIYGLEASADARLSERWTSFATLGLQHGEATSYTTNVSQGGTLVSTDLSGNRLPMSASSTYSLGVRYDEGEGWFGQASVNGSSPYYFDSQNTLKQSAFATVDAEIGHRFDSVEVSLWAANLFGENVYSRAVSAPLGIIAEDGAPREIGLRLSATW